jgi:phage/plasmid-associated DNA primase
MDLFDNVFSDPTDREWFMRWAGVMIHMPEFKPAWSIHIFSQVRGVGKDTVANVLRVLYGPDNVCNVGSDVFTNQFNKDLFLHGMAVLSDFTSISNAKTDQTSNAFKQISGTTVYSRRDMYTDPVQAPINIRFLFLSNSGLSFPIDVGDRRLYLMESEGTKLDSRTALLCQLFINPKNIKESLLEKVGGKMPD